MYQLGLAEVIQADREREVAELVRQRRLLEPEAETGDVDPERDRRLEARPPQVRTQAAGS